MIIIIIAVMCSLSEDNMTSTKMKTGEKEKKN